MQVQINSTAKFGILSAGPSKDNRSIPNFCCWVYIPFIYMSIKFRIQVSQIWSIFSPLNMLSRTWDYFYATRKSIWTVILLP